MSSGFISVNKENWESEVKNYSGLVVVDYSAEWCGPCKIFEPTLNSIIEEYKDRVKFVKVDFNANTELCKSRGVMSGLPRLQFIIEDTSIEDMSGCQPREKIRKTIDSYLEKLNRT